MVKSITLSKEMFRKNKNIKETGAIKAFAIIERSDSDTIFSSSESSGNISFEDSSAPLTQAQISNVIALTFSEEEFGEIENDLYSQKSFDNKSRTVHPVVCKRDIYMEDTKEIVKKKSKIQLIEPSHARHQLAKKSQKTIERNEIFKSRINDQGEMMSSLQISSLIGSSLTEEDFGTTGNDLYNPKSSRDYESKIIYPVIFKRDILHGRPIEKNYNNNCL